ncbi:MAG TPA: hypothetical protein VIX37_19160 [Candidatus Sulfotelmatobacter sp.]
MIRLTRLRGSRPARVLWLLLLVLNPFVSSTRAQEPEIVFHTSSNLVLVDVVALNNGLPVKTLKRDDFRLFDNAALVPIKTFDSGAEFTTRPLALWFVVLCNMQGYEAEGSGFFRGQINLLEPALKNMEKQDRLGVAHWCDDGQSNLDLQPTSDVSAAVGALEQVLAPVPDTKSHDREGELALQKTLQLIVDATRSAKPEPLPVVIFLYGDHSGMPKSEADHFVDELLETSAMAFGIRDSRSPHIWFLIGEQKEVAHYIATQTGGRYLDATRDTYASALAAILQQLHFRYQLGFQPATLDGKRHMLTVKLADTVKGQHKGVRLRYRAVYVPARDGGK